MTRWAASGMACNYAQKTAFNALKKLFLAVSFPLRGDTSMDGSPHRVLPALCDPTSLPSSAVAGVRAGASREKEHGLLCKASGNGWV